MSADSGSLPTVGGFQTRKPQQRRRRSDPFDFARTGSPNPNCPSPKASDLVASLLSWLLLIEALETMRYLSIDCCYCLVHIS